MTDLLDGEKYSYIYIYIYIICVCVHVCACVYVCVSGQFSGNNLCRRTLLLTYYSIALAFHEAAKPLSRFLIS